MQLEKHTGMTLADAREVVALLSARYPHQVPDETADIWARDLATERGLAKADAIEGCRRMAKHHPRASFHALLEASNAVRRERVQRDEQAQRDAVRPVLPPTNIARALRLALEWREGEVRAGRTPSDAEMEQHMRALSTADH